MKALPAIKKGIISASIDRRIPQRPEYLAVLSGDYQYWVLEVPKVLQAKETLSISFKTAEDLVGRYFVDTRAVAGGAFLLINGTGGWDWSDDITGITLDGVPVVKYAPIESNDNVEHELVITFGAPNTVSSIGVSQWDSNWFAGAITKVEYEGYSNKLNNPETEDVQAPEKGTGSMTMIEYEPEVWVPR